VLPPDQWETLRQQAMSVPAPALLPTLAGGRRSAWVVDLVVAAILVVLIAVGVDLHH
jgi:hypothetical protein